MVDVFMTYIVLKYISMLDILGLYCSAEPHHEAISFFKDTLDGVLDGDGGLQLSALAMEVTEALEVMEVIIAMIHSSITNTTSITRPSTMIMM